MASYHPKTKVYGLESSKKSKKSQYAREKDPYSPEKVMQFAGEFDDLIKNRHLGREGIIHFETPGARKNRKIEEEIIREENGKAANL